MDNKIFLDIAIILMFTKVFGIMSKKVHIPQVLGALISGIVLGPSILGWIEYSEPIKMLSEIGVVLLLFNAGLETDLKIMKKTLGKTLTIGIIEVAVSFAMGYALGIFINLTVMQSLFIGVMLTATSLGITVESLTEMGKMKTNEGTGILGVAVVDDILGIVLLTIVMNIATMGTVSFVSIGIILLKIAAFFGFALLCGNGVDAIIEYTYKKSGKRHTLTVLSLAYCFFMAYAAQLFGLADITGAYIAGLTLSKLEVSKYVESKSNVLSYAMFSPIFFASIGLNTQLRNLTSNLFVIALALIAVAVVSKLVGNYAGAKIVKYPNVEAIPLSIGMISRGEVTLVMANTAVAMAILDTTLFPAIILMVIATTLITPLLLKAYYSSNYYTSHSKNKEA